MVELSLALAATHFPLNCVVHYLVQRYDLKLRAIKLLRPRFARVFPEARPNPYQH